MNSGPSSHIMPTYGRLPVEFVRGEGVMLFDEQGNAYLDAISGIAVCALGHSHPAVTAAITSQAGQLIHTSNLYHIGRQNQLADLLCSVSGMENVFFGNSGAEANEAAIKLARLYANQRGIEQPKVITFHGSFHGRTMATLSATANQKIQQGFAPLLSGFDHIAYNDIDALSAFSNDPNVVAVLVEPVQGEGGVNVPKPDFLSKIREICDHNRWLMMVDEVQTGNGRTGQYFAYQHEAILPDVVTTAKGLGNGVPIGACLTQGLAASLMQAGSHGSTYGGNPLVCAAALATVSTIIDEVLPELPAKAEYFSTQLQQKLADSTIVEEVRNKGFMLGISLNRDCGELVSMALEHGLLINVTAGHVIRLLPPLIMQHSEIDQVCDILCKLIYQLEHGQKVA